MAHFSREMSYLIFSHVSTQDEVSEFLGGILSQGPPILQEVRVEPVDIEVKKRKRHTSSMGDELDGIPYSVS